MPSHRIPQGSCLSNIGLLPFELDALSQTQKVEYFDVNGVPVAAIDDVEVYRYDTPTPEWFPSTSIMDDGVEITKEEFTALLPPTF